MCKRISIAERPIVAEVADWIYGQINGGVASVLKEGSRITQEFHNADNENFSIIIEKREEIDGVQWYDILRTAWYVEDGETKVYDEELVFSAREDMQITSIEKELNAVDFDYFY